MAYAAVVSLKLTIQRLLDSCDQIPILPPYPEILQLAYNEGKCFIWKTATARGKGKSERQLLGHGSQLSNPSVSVSVSLLAEEDDELVSSKTAGHSQELKSHWILQNLSFALMILSISINLNTHSES
ncbi:UNVERIFIED_CONTAM: hypothetical protein Sindi_0187000 [Sesamum indicum]